jgi:drug/metabolite transporter (DMT)-like permease
MRAFHLIILLIMNFFWGTVFATYKVLAPDLPGTGAVVTLRFGLAALCFLVAWPWLPGLAPRGKDLATTCFMGVMLYVLGQRLQVEGNRLGTAGNSAVLIGLEPLVASVGAGIFLKEHIGPRRMIGFALGLAGVLVLNGIWRPGFRWVGLGASALFVSSFVCEAAYSVMGKKIVQRASVMKMLAISLLVGTVANLLIDGTATVQLAGILPLRAWGLLLLLSVICTAVGYTVWFVVIRDCPVNVAALTVFAQSVFGVTVAAVWVGEKVSWEQALGAATIVAGLVVGLSRQIKKGSGLPPAAASQERSAR